jgi:hypothetical protein
MFKKHLKKKQIHAKSYSELDKIHVNYSVEIPKELGKNKWLYPADEFVKKWKKPKYYKSKTFEL